MKIPLKLYEVFTVRIQQWKEVVKKERKIISLKVSVINREA